MHKDDNDIQRFVGARRRRHALRRWTYWRAALSPQTYNLGVRLPHVDFSDSGLAIDRLLRAPFVLCCTWFQTRQVESYNIQCMGDGSHSYECHRAHVGL